MPHSWYESPGLPVRLMEETLVFPCCSPCLQAASLEDSEWGFNCVLHAVFSVVLCSSLPGTLWTPAASLFQDIGAVNSSQELVGTPLCCSHVTVACNSPKTTKVAGEDLVPLVAPSEMAVPGLVYRVWPTLASCFILFTGVCFRY